MSSPPPAAAEKRVIGWVEPVQLTSPGIVLDAKIDTGADVTSIHARVQQLFAQGGKKWVRFRLTGDNGRTALVEARIVRYAKIKKKEATERAQTRKVVMLDLCLGGTRKSVEVNLVDRSHFDYPLLIGRNFLIGDFVVDASREHTTLPRCDEAPSSAESR